jgi:hypothetical protein
VLYTNNRFETCEIDADKLSPALLAYQALERHNYTLMAELKEVQDSLFDRSERMREDGFDGEFDPLADLKFKRGDLESAIKGNDERLKAMAAKFSKEDNAIHQMLLDDAHDQAVDDAADRRTRWQEGGWAEESRELEDPRD